MVMSWNEEEVETKLRDEGVGRDEASHLVTQKKKDIIDKRRSKKIQEILDSLVETEEEEERI
jgi:adenylosuccinate lyase